MAGTMPLKDFNIALKLLTPARHILSDRCDVCVSMKGVTYGTPGPGFVPWSHVLKVRARPCFFCILFCILFAFAPNAAHSAAFLA